MHARRISRHLDRLILLCRRVSLAPALHRLSLHLPPPYLPPIPIPILPPIPHPPCSRGITDVAIMSSVGPRPNCSIKAATDPAALAMYANADKILCF